MFSWRATRQVIASWAASGQVIIFVASDMLFISGTLRAHMVLCRLISASCDTNPAKGRVIQFAKTNIVYIIRCSCRKLHRTHQLSECPFVEQWICFGLCVIEYCYFMLCGSKWPNLNIPEPALFVKSLVKGFGGR